MIKLKALTARKLEQSITQYNIVIVAVLLIGAYFGYQNFLAFSKMSGDLNSAQTRVIDLQKQANLLAEEFNLAKKDVESTNTSLYASLDAVMPETEDFTNLARVLDNYFLENGNLDNNLFLSNLTFSPALIMAEKDYSVLPFNMTVESKYDAFRDFLKYIENSGDLNDKVRLMDTSTINVSFSDPIAAVDEGSAVAISESNDLASKNVSANLTMQAYFKKPSSN